MHRGHDHDHELDGSAPGIAGVGHNRASAPPRPLQWQVLHDTPKSDTATAAIAVDVDLVEAAFVEGFQAASDPTSFLRLAKVPFQPTAADGTKLSLLRVEIDFIADVGTIAPHLGGDTFRYDPLPASMVSRRRRLRFIYFDGTQSRSLGLVDILALSPE